MLGGLTTIAMGRLFYGLVVFEPEIVGIRLLFAFLASMLVGLFYYLLRAPKPTNQDQPSEENPPYNGNPYSQS